MDGELNVTYLIFGGHVELSKYRYLYFAVMLTAYILILCSNSTIMCLIRFHRDLHEPMYVFIAALSLNSVLLSTAIYPKLLIDFLSETRSITYPACLFQSWVCYSVACSDFLLLSAMAYDRYVSICKPLRYSTIMSKTTVCVLLGVAWFLPACEGSVIVAEFRDKKLCGNSIPGIFCNNTYMSLHCVLSRTIQAYILFVLINVTFLPMLFILFTYVLILIIAHRRQVMKKAMETCLPHLLVLLCFSCLCAYDVVIAHFESEVSKTVRLIMTIQNVLYNPLLHPIIYGLKMKEISKHLRQLLSRLNC